MTLVSMRTDSGATDRSSIMRGEGTRRMQRRNRCIAFMRLCFDANAHEYKDQKSYA